MNIKRVVPTLLILTLLFALTSCGKKPEVQTPPTTQPLQTTPPALEPIVILANAGETYKEAAAALSGVKDMKVTINASEVTTVAGEALTKTKAQTILYNNLGSDNMIAQANEIIQVADNQIPYGITYENGVGYYTVVDGKFVTSLTAETFMARYAPAALLRAELYENIEGISDGIITSITFSKPTALEAWVAPENAVLVSASGTATLDAGGALLESSYAVKYTVGDKTIEKHVRAIVDTAKPVITVPEASGYISLENPDALLLMEQAVGYLQQAPTVTSKTTESIVCESFSDSWTQTMTINIHSEGVEYSARRDVTSTKVTAGRIDAPETMTQSTKYIGGTEITVIDGGTPVESTDISQDTMRSFFNELLMSTILKSQYITSLTVTEEGDVYRLDFTANDEMAKIMRQEACITLYEDVTPLEGLRYDVNTMTGYIIIDKLTLLPTASGIVYDETHYVGEYPYKLSFTAEQTYTIPSESALDAINAA